MTQAEMCQEDKVGGRCHKRWLGADCQNWGTADDDGDVDDGDNNGDDGDVDEDVDDADDNGDWDFDDGEGNVDDGDKENHQVF